MAIFNQYATYYDLYYKNKDYKAEAQYVSRVIRRAVENPQTILEFGCGTGAHAVELIKEGFDVIGIDFSEEMLERAAARKSVLEDAQQQRLGFFKGDARTTRLTQRTDAVVSLFHVMSYQAKNSDLIASFQSASANLEIGGAFAFDFWYGPCVLSVRPETRVSEMENDKVSITRIARPVLLEDENCVLVTLTILVCEKDTGIQHKFEETHKMRYLFLPEVDEYLERAGMRRVSTLRWMSEHALDSSAWSGFIVATKHANV